MVNRSRSLYHLLAFTLVGSILVSCEQPTNLLGNQDRLVVEGWISSDGHPVVLLHRSYNLNNPEHKNLGDDASIEDVFMKQLIAWAKVSISDGDTTVLLNGRINRDYFPPTTYTTTWMEGVPGKTYTIHVDYLDYHATASSTMLQPWSLDSLRVTHVDNDTVDYVMAYFSGFTSDTTYLLLQYRQSGDLQYRMGPLAVRHSYMAIDGVLSIPMTLYDKSHTPCYDIRVARVGKREYEYFNLLMSRLAVGGAYFLSMFGSMPLIIDGACGYWAALGSRDYRISTQRDTTYIYTE